MQQLAWLWVAEMHTGKPMPALFEIPECIGGTNIKNIQFLHSGINYLPEGLQNLNPAFVTVLSNDKLIVPYSARYKLYTGDSNVQHDKI